MALLEVGRVVRPHGLLGEVVVELVTNRLERLAQGALLDATRPGNPDDSVLRLEVLSARPQGNRFLVRFAGMTSRDDAESLRDLVLHAESVADPDSFFVHELIGSLLFDQHGTAHGRVVAVEANPASDLLVLEAGGLVPLRFVVACRPGEIEAEIPEGLLE